MTSSAPASPRPSSPSALPDVVDRLLAHPAQDEVLVDGGAGVAAAVVAHDLRPGRGTAPGCRSPRVTLTCDGEKPAWRWGCTLDAQRSGRTPAVAVGAVAFSGRRPGALASSSSGTAAAWGRSRARPPSRPAAPPRLARGSASVPILVDQDLDAGAGAVLAQPVLAVEDPQDGLGDLQVLAVVAPQEVVDRRRDAGHDRGAAADAQLDALTPRRRSRGRAR